MNRRRKGDMKRHRPGSDWVIMKRDVGAIGSNDRKKLGDAIRHGPSFEKGTMNRRAELRLHNLGMLAEIRGQWVVVIPWQDAYEKYLAG